MLVTIESGAFIYLVKLYLMYRYLLRTHKKHRSNFRPHALWDVPTGPLECGFDILVTTALDATIQGIDDAAEVGSLNNRR